MADLNEIAAALAGKVRGRPVAISLFPERIPESYTGRRVDPCAIVRHAMDLGERVYVDREYQDCISGAFTGGFHEGTEITRTGQYIAKNISAYTDLAAARIKSGSNVLPQGSMKGIGAAPLDDVPDGVHVDWICVVCTPYWANFIGAARTVIDGTPPRSSAGISFCADLFASPWHDNNVCVTPGDIGGRMNNKLKPEEMFVVIPMEWADSLVKILSTTPDAKAVYECVKPDDSEYWVKKQAKADKEAAKKAVRSEAVAASVSTVKPGLFARAKKAVMKGSMKAMVKIQGTGEDMGDLPLSMTWDAEAEALIRRAPKGIVEMAINNIEEFAEEKDYDRITRAVIIEQMQDSGMDPAILEG